MKLSAFVAIAAVIGGSYSWGATAVSASEWEASCGVSRSNLYQCRVIKGDAIFKGIQGWLHTYVLPDGRRYYFFYDSRSSQCIYVDTYLKTDSGDWFSVTPICTSDGYISFQLPSGNIAFLTEY